jgi:hypothetical protein
MKLPDGTYYQVCVHCGVEYGYDWERMRRTTATPQASASIKNYQPGRTDKKSA